MNIKIPPILVDLISEYPAAQKRSIIKVNSLALVRFFTILLVLAVASGLRLWGLDHIGFNTDEAVYSGQAAAIAQVPLLKDIFPIFRAHPLLFQFILAVIFRFQVSDLSARLAAVVVGVATVFLVYRLGRLLYGERTGILAAVVLAIMPYHVTVTRQVLLDGPLVFFSTLSLFLLAKYAETEHPIWLHAVGIGMGLTFLAKETGIILLGAIYAFLALSSEIRIRIKDLAISIILMVLTILPFPISIWLAGSSSTGQKYFVWQLFRRPNHTWDFYPLTVTPTMGILVVLLAVAGLWALRDKRSWRERLLVWWILVPIIFFQIWPTKGYQYLLPIAPPMAILACRALMHWTLDKSASDRRRKLNLWTRTLATGTMLFSLLLPSLQIAQPAATGTFIAGTGGVPGGREAGLWVNENIPVGSTLLTIGPSMANILEFYGYRKAYGISVSPNPLHRNPSYTPVNNPDLQIRTNEIQYLVWDSYSAERSDFFSSKILELAKRFNGRVVHVETITITQEDGVKTTKPVIIIYKVHP